MRLLLIIVTLILSPAVFSQTDSAQVKNDSLSQAREQKRKIYSGPRKASIMSAVLPGLGQAYNRKYWKIPVIYAALGGLGYVFKTNNDQFNTYRAALRQSVSDGTGFATVNDFRYSTRELQLQKKAFQRLRDIGLIGMGIVYVLNILDANVDAHLRTFDISDDLSMSISPQPHFSLAYGLAKPVPGCRLVLQFK